MPHKVAIAADHAGFALKEALKLHLQSRNYEVCDLGTNSNLSVDYPDFAHKVAEKVANGGAGIGVLICGSGIGMAIAANRHKNVRAVVIENDSDAKMSRSHNNANIACFGARRTETAEAIKLLDIFLATPFDGERHEKRIHKIER